MQLMLLTGDPVYAQKAQDCGVDRIFLAVSDQEAENAVVDSCHWFHTAEQPLQNSVEIPQNLFALFIAKGLHNLAIVANSDYNHAVLMIFASKQLLHFAGEAVIIQAAGHRVHFHATVASVNERKGYSQDNNRKNSQNQKNMCIFRIAHFRHHISFSK